LAADNGLAAAPACHRLGSSNGSAGYQEDVEVR